jgi:anti-sigma factor RsiW
MPRPTDDRLIAYLDGELGDAERAEVAHWLEHDGELRQRASALGESAALLRAAFDEVLREPVPERLVAAARGPAEGGAAVVDLAGARERRAKPRLRDRRWWIVPAAAAAIAGIAVGIGISRSLLWEATPVASSGSGGSEHSPNFVDNIPGYYLHYATVGPSEGASFDKLPQNFHVPDLKPWGLEYRGARFVMVEGHEAMQLFYGTDNKALGPVMVIVADSPGPDDHPRFKHGDVNVWSWRSHGHTYAVAGTANMGYLWNIQNDLAYQFDGI